MGMGGLRWAVLGWVSVFFGWAQKTESALQLRIVVPVTFPYRVQAAFSVAAKEFYSYNVPPFPLSELPCAHIATVGRGDRPCPKAQEGGDWVIEANVNRIPADRVRAVVIMMPNCKLQLLDVAMQGKNQTRDAKCLPAPIWKFKGQIADDVATGTKWLKVHVQYRANWAPKFLGVERAGVDQPPPEAPEFDVATVALSKDKSFLIDLPVLYLDPAEESAEPEKRGEFIFTLLNTEPKIPVVLGTLRADQFATEADGLELRTEYPELQFVLKH
jgi:hypothetical protein